MIEKQKMGMNRTGIQMSPKDSKLMEEGARSARPAPGDEHDLANLRNPYRLDGDRLGSIPVPGKVKGVVEAGKAMLGGNRPQAFLDKLGERLAFERSGTRLYDALIEKFEAVDGLDFKVPIETLQQFRDEEARHFKLVVSAVEQMGGDPTSQTPCADVAGVEAMGLMQTITDPRTTATQCLHAILVAELVDNDGWDNLVLLAEEMGETDMASSFRVALEEEVNHLQQVRAWYQEASLGEAGIG